MAAQTRRQAERKGISFNAYVLRALEEQLRADKDQEPVKDRRGRDREAPRGLGLGRARGPAPELPPPALAEGPAPVVVNVGAPGTTTGATGDLISALCVYVVGGPMFERERRTRQAKDILRAQPGQTPEERQRLEELFEGALREDKKQAQRPSLPSSIGSLFAR